MKFQIALISLIFLMSCAGPKEDKGSKSEVFNTVYNEDNLKSQEFYVDCSVDNIIDGLNGTKIRIEKESFIDQQGNIIQDSIKIELVEAIDPLSMVMGNLTTIFDGKPLESGGMIRVNASLNKENLELAPNKNLLVSIPSDTILGAMSLFEGERDTSGNFNWFNPEPMALQNEIESDSLPNQILMQLEKSHNIRYSVEGFQEQLDQPQFLRDEVSRIAWEGAGLKITKDSTFKIDTFTVYFYKQDTLTFWGQEFSVKQGTNSYVTDQNVYYIFKMNKLGWANIDRLLDDPRTTDVELFVDVFNHNEFNYVYTTMVTQRMYLPGYQQKDDSYSFTHGDFEKTKLPIGERATIIATASKGGNIYFDFQTIDISVSQKIELNLTETSKKKIEKALEKEL